MVSDTYVPGSGWLRLSGDGMKAVLRMPLSSSLSLFLFPSWKKYINLIRNFFFSDP